MSFLPCTLHALFVRTGVAALLSLACVSAAVAQHANVPSSPGAWPEPFDGIQLTPVQRTAIEADWAKRRPALSVITARMRAAGGITDADRAELKQFAEARNAVVRAILTPEQRAQLERNILRITEARRQHALLRRGQP